MKYTKNQNGFLGQEFLKVLLEKNPNATEFEKELVQDLGLELTLIKSYYSDFSKEHIINCLKKVSKDDISHDKALTRPTPNRFVNTIIGNDYDNDADFAFRNGEYDKEVDWKGD